MPLASALGLVMCHASVVRPVRWNYNRMYQAARGNDSSGIEFVQALEEKCFETDAEWEAVREAHPREQYRVIMGTLRTVAERYFAGGDGKQAEADERKAYRARRVQLLQRRGAASVFGAEGAVDAPRSKARVSVSSRGRVRMRCSYVSCSWRCLACP